MKSMKRLKKRIEELKKNQKVEPAYELTLDNGSKVMLEGPGADGTYILGKVGCEDLDEETKALLDLVRHTIDVKPEDGLIQLARAILLSPMDPPDGEEEPKAPGAKAEEPC